jgi:predicted Zn-dependent peptidase
LDEVDPLAVIEFSLSCDACSHTWSAVFEPAREYARERAASRPERIDRYLQAKVRLDAITPSALQAMAKRYLALPQAVTVLVLPKEAKAPEK